MSSGFLGTDIIGMVTVVLLLLSAGAFVFSVLAIIAAERYRAVHPPDAPAIPPPVSILKPLHGLDEGLQDNLRSFFDQDYPSFELLFAVGDEADRAVPEVERLMTEFPGVESRLMFAGEGPTPNAKAHSLGTMLAYARHDLVVMADSDVRVPRGFIRAMAAEMSGENVALVTCPYRAVAGERFWSQLEAVGLNTEFISGVLVARMLNGMDFALGPAIATRKRHLAEIGGMEDLQQYLAEDFVMGNRLAQRGYRVVLSSQAIEHRIGSQDFRANLDHRLRWNRSTRRSRPAGYVGQIFMYPIPIALALVAWAPGWWPFAVSLAAIRYVAAWRACVTVGASLAYGWLPAQDLMSFGTWVAGFFGNRITWRTRSFSIDGAGRFRPSNE